MTPAILLLSLVTAERLAEALFARNNAKGLLRRGGVEVGAKYFPLVVMLHVSWLGTMWYFGASRPLQPVWVAVFLAIEVARFWVLVSLGRGRTSRLFTMPQQVAPRGPFRWTSRPDQIVVVAEMVVLPLCFGLPDLALVFCLANLAVLILRVEAENRAMFPNRRK